MNANNKIIENKPNPCFAYTPKKHLHTIFCNMTPQNAHVDRSILNTIHHELLIILKDKTIDKCKISDVRRAMKNTSQEPYMKLYQHEIFYKLTGKPRPYFSQEQLSQIMDYFETHKYKYQKSKDCYYYFEDIIKDIDAKLGFNQFIHLDFRYNLFTPINPSIFTQTH